MAKLYFEYDDVDAYSSAVGVINSVITHALADSSIGMGGEIETLVQVRSRLRELDTHGVFDSTTAQAPQTLRELYDKASDGNV